MSDYTYKDMMRMQSEAKQRVIEMQKRSKLVADSFNDKNRAPKNENIEIENTNENEDLPRIAKAISYPTEITTVHPRQTHENSRNKHIISDLRESLKKVFGNITGGDSEKLFIMALCLLLAEESTDDSLIMALMYLLT